MKSKKLLYSILTIGVLLGPTAQAQLSAPNVENVYGGRINAITAVPLGVDSSRVFISTESANSMFYADVHSVTATPSFGSFAIVPGLGAGDGYGSGIQLIAGHAGSGTVVFAHDRGIMEANVAAGAITALDTNSGYPSTLNIRGNTILYVTGPNLHFGQLDSAGNYTQDVNSPVPGLPFLNQPTLFISTLDDSVYLFSQGSTPNLYKLSDTYDGLTSATTYRDISPTTLSTTVMWTSFGVAPSGRLFILGSEASGKYAAYSDDETTWTSYATGIGGAAGKNIAFTGDSSNYKVYWASCYNDSNGLSGHWLGFGNMGQETHPNDGAVFTGQANPSIIYMTTDQGIGASINGGKNIFEIDDGVEAVQVNDMDMTVDKNTAWIASKSGIRHVVDYQTSSPLWTTAMFPNGDGSPYYSVAMNPEDSTTVYAGNLRVYKTTDEGATWNQVFSTENPPVSWGGFGVKALALEVCPYDPNIVFAGFEIADSLAGGLFYSTDAGAAWDQLLLEETVSGYDVDVTDVAFNIEGTDTVAYVSALYDLDFPSGRSIYRLTKSGSSWTVARDMDASGTSTGTTIVATIWDLEVSATGDTIYAAGTDAGINHPVAYYKPIDGTGLWTPLSITGFPTEKEATAIEIGVDTVYCAVGSDIYYLPLAGSSWDLGYSYPVGTRVNFLYWDDLLAGSDLGLYAFFGSPVTTVNGDSKRLPTDYTLYQNYPNPFNPSTIISYSLPITSQVRLTIYDVIGREVATLVNTVQTAGLHKVTFDAANLATGIYFYQIQTGDFSATKKFVLMK
ncbi:MAG: T9SS type A sorting domain-containing protein [Candidatus Marinimicrobia bacterium]|nr:T9SS type A sorting domain-containing protein [Candidatus Neomarinimicrobiota bacterium]